MRLWTSENDGNASGNKGPTIGFCMSNRILGNFSWILNEVSKSGYTKHHQTKSRDDSEPQAPSHSHVQTVAHPNTCTSHPMHLLIICSSYSMQHLHSWSTLSEFSAAPLHRHEKCRRRKSGPQLGDAAWETPRLDEFWKNRSGVVAAQASSLYRKIYICACVCAQEYWTPQIPKGSPGLLGNI